MIATPKLKRVLSEFRQAVRPMAPMVDTADEAAWREARIAWTSDFGDFNPIIDDADLLEIGGTDARLGALLLTPHPGRGAARTFACLGATADEPGAPRVGNFGDRLHLHPDARVFDALESGAYDIVLCRDWQAWCPEDALEARLARIYDLLRPGGEFLVIVDCADLLDFGPAAKGYGVMTPSSWMMAFQRAGFEVGEVIRSLRTLESAGRAQAVLPLTSDDERSTARMRCRLIRPWEAWELNLLRTVDQGPPT